ncbi:hypothetical protein N7917_05820 [Bacillus sp. OR9]|nr:hypothetical protein [Bacillus sp. OR9]
MIIIFSIYFVLSLFAGTIWILKKDRKGKKDQQNSIVILIVGEVLIFIILGGILFTSDYKNSNWLAPIASGVALLGLAIFIVMCIGLVLMYKKDMVKEFLSENGLILLSYSIISAILIFLTFLIIVGVLYATYDDFKIEGFSNFVGLAGIITTLLGILVTLWQFLGDKSRT